MLVKLAEKMSGLDIAIDRLRIAGCTASLATQSEELGWQVVAIEGDLKGATVGSCKRRGQGSCSCPRCMGTVPSILENTQPAILRATSNARVLSVCDYESKRCKQPPLDQCQHYAPIAVRCSNGGAWNRRIAPYACAWTLEALHVPPCEVSNQPSTYRCGMLDVIFTTGTLL